MAIKRYTATADNTITNAYKKGFLNRATGSNAGRADILEVFSLYGRESSSSSELSRILLDFPIDTIVSDRNSKLLPDAGGVSFYLRLFDAQTSYSVPKDFKLVVSPLSKSWTEGEGLDLENYKDSDASNWISASYLTPWDSEGGDYIDADSVEDIFTTGLEDLEVDITDIVEKWISGENQQNGIGVYLSSSYEASTKSYYTKRFFARGTQYFYKKPIIEARWNSSKKDDRGSFYMSSSLSPAADNINTIYLYNYSRGILSNIPSVGTGEIYVNLYETIGGSPLSLSIDTPATGGWVSTGVYTASICVEGDYTTLYDVWYKDGVQFHTGSITPKTTSANTISTRSKKYLINITNLKNRYSNDEIARFNIYARERGWSPTIYTVAQQTPENITFHSASYKIFRTIDSYEVIPHGTGSDGHTIMSYDSSGNYFDLDLSILEPDYEYGIRFSIYEPDMNSWMELPETFKFRVEEYEY